MRNICNIVRDLLPLYAEGIASEDTVSLVEEHLETCEACRAVLSEMKTPNETGSSCEEPESSALPLKVFRRKWKRKKLILVCSTILVTIVLMCCSLFAVERFLYQEKITVNNGVYTQTNDVVVDLPAGSVEIGYLRGISHRSTADPMGNFMGTNLDNKYGGCPIYQSGGDEEIIYLEDCGGFYLTFRLTDQLPQEETPPE